MEKLIECLSTLEKPGNTVKLILCGDFNINILLSNNIKVSSSMFEDTLTTFGPTRYTKSSKIFIDNIAVSKDNIARPTSKVVITAVRDHNA